MRDHDPFDKIVSRSPRMQAIFDLIRSVAATSTTVLIEGETGTGKEQVAMAIHRASRAEQGPWVAVNCAALPETLLGSELFGHEKGAFTSAQAQRRGRFELADGGTIFLDEIGDIPASMQATLLRVLQERSFERVGGRQSIQVDVRLIAATNRSLQRLVQEGKFREDLYYRVNVLKIELPPLRERSEDIPLLADHFAAKFAPRGEAPKRVSPECLERLMHYSWPGNVRELENVIERACALCPGNTLSSEHLPDEVLHPAAGGRPWEVDLSKTLPQLLREVQEDIEVRYLYKALEKSRGNVGRCAEICGLSRRCISAKMTAYQISRAPFAKESVEDDEGALVAGEN